VYILYLDESGLHAQAPTFVLGGVAVFEREVHWFSEDVEAIQHRYFPGHGSPVEFHVSQLRAPQGSIPEPFNALTVEQRRQLITDMYQIVRDRRGIVFAAAIEKTWCREDPYERAFEELTNRFDLFLRRQNALQATTSQVRAIADVPFFVPAANTRLLQLADFCANAVHGRYNSGHTRDFDVIAPKVDREGTRVHGMVHLSRNAECTCLACFGRQYGRAVEIP
jgi:hypothetical protein